MTPPQVVFESTEERHLEQARVDTPFLPEQAPAPVGNTLAGEGSSSRMTTRKQKVSPSHECGSMIDPCTDLPQGFQLSS